MGKFKDLFSGHAEDYAEYRPGYPEELYQFVAEQCKNYDIAWDCATGSGQTAIGIAPYFERVFASDASASQVENAFPHENVTYFVSTAYHSGLPAHSIDLVTISQALHWLDFEAFFKEVNRVLRPGGILAAWCYLKPSVNKEMEPLITRYLEEIVGPYWPPEREYVDNGYQSIDFPFDEIDAPEFRASHHWDLERFLGYLNTWSAAKRFHRDKGYSPVDEIRDAMSHLWENPKEEKNVTWPIRMRIGMKK